jgi:hypothetical protein
MALSRVTSPEPTSTDPKKMSRKGELGFAYVENWLLPKESLFGLDEVVGQKF